MTMQSDESSIIMNISQLLNYTVMKSITLFRISSRSSIRDEI